MADALDATEPGASKKNIVELTREQRQIIYDDAKRQSLSVLYHLQNFVHERAPDKTNSFRHFHLSGEFGTPDNLPPKPYIREALRLKAMYMMREQDGRNRDGKDKTTAKERFSHVMYEDGLFAWQFHYDYHNTGRAYLVDEGESGPWIDYEKEGRHTRNVSDRSWFPLRSLIPEKMDGLLGAQKNLGYSSIVCAAIRLHDHGVHVGQAAGATAALALSKNKKPRDMAYERASIEAIRGALCGETEGAVPLLVWPWRDLPADHPAFAAINRLASLGALPLDPREVDFKPDEPAKNEWIEAVREISAGVFEGELPSVEFALPPTRGEFCVAWWGVVRELPLRPFQRQSDTDADGDGIADADDALLFTPNAPIVWEIEVVPAEPHEDGLPPEPTAGVSEPIQINFCGARSEPVDAFQADHGRVFDAARGFGWGRDLTANVRQRNDPKDSLKNAFVFTRGSDQWEHGVENGEWKVTVCVGDGGHEQRGQRVKAEGVIVIDQVDTAEGRFWEASAVVNVKDGRLTLDLGPQGPGENTCLNWVRLERL